VAGAVLAAAPTISPCLHAAVGATTTAALTELKVPATVIASVEIDKAQRFELENIKTPPILLVIQIE
jgi:hypothetical protein